MNTPLDLVPRPSSVPHPVPGDEVHGLAAFLEFFSADEAAGAAARPSLRTSGRAVLGWAQDSSRRAARWGAVAGVSS